MAVWNRKETRRRTPKYTTPMVMSSSAGRMLKITEVSKSWMEDVPRSMTRSTSPVLRCRWYRSDSLG